MGSWTQVQGATLDFQGSNTSVDLQAPRHLIDWLPMTDGAENRDCVVDPSDTHSARPDESPHRRHSTTYEKWIKPPLDFLGATLLLIISVPLAAGVGLCILGSMGTPLLFRQERIAKGGKAFTMFKFRTMDPDRRTQQVPFRGPDRRIRHKSIHDPRITKVGAFLRRWSLDELPQFVNVLLGHMSLVGPRPELRSVVESKYEPWQHRRHEVKPGITGVWQISDQREDLMLNATHIDLQYLEQVSFINDARILLLTIPAALGYRQKTAQSHHRLNLR